MWRPFSVLLSILLLAFGVSSSGSPPTIRRTANGPVEGLEKISSLGQKYYSFRGIPFAEAPITGTDPYTGEQVDRRFKAPKPLKRRWTDALKAHDFEKTCAQPKASPAFPVELSKMGEDCLFLNVYVPAGGSEHKTVLVWIYGGGFIIGDATDNLYGPDFLLSQDNIVVTINYRLGIFGFLDLNFDEYTGNMGLKDQQLALKWIHENIEHFSGNKNEILLFGQSAGAASVHLQMLNEESRSYFHRVFAVSGSAFQPYLFVNVNHAQHVQNCLNITEANQLIPHLKTENINVLISCPAFETLNDSSFNIWVPVIESNDTKNAFLTKTPEEIYNEISGAAPIMDAMFSFTAQEASLPAYNISVSEGSEPLIKENVTETTEFALPFKGFTKKTHPKKYAEALRKLRKVYFTNTSNIDGIKRANADLLSDSTLNYFTIKTVAFQSNANYKAANEIWRKKTFLFRFNVTADLNLMKMSFKNLTDATHSDDICYMFHCHFMDEMHKYDKHLEQKDSVYELIMRSVKIITNFARTGDPSIEGDTPFKLINSIDEMFCQEVGNELKTSVTNDIRQQKHYDLWHEIETLSECRYKSNTSTEIVNKKAV